MADFSVLNEKEIVWRIDNNHKWNLFTNTKKDLNPRLTEEELKKITEQQKDKVANPFYTSKEKKEIKGALIYTSKGYGIVQNVKSDSNTISVRVGGNIEDFSRDEVTYEIPVALSFFSKGTRRDEIAIFSVQSTAKEVLEKIEEGESKETGIACQIFWKGKELPKTNENLEKLGFTPLCKLLVTSSFGKFFSVNRYKMKYNGWCYSGSSTDGITFSTNKDIRLAGFGVYLSQNDTIPATLRFCEGDNCLSGDYFSTEVTLSKDMEEEPESQIYQYKFDKPVRIKAGEKYTCVAQLKSGNTAYGSDGQTTVDGEKDVIFTFTNAQNSGNGTSTSSGQIPTFYYYA